MWYYGIPCIYFLILYITSRSIRGQTTIHPVFIHYYNIILSFLSLILSIHGMKIVIQHRTDPFALICQPIDLHPSMNLFYLLKYVEWIDSIVLVVRGRALSRLHMIHHAIVPIMVHRSFGMPGQIYALLSNSIAHFMMYGYYAFPSWRIYKSYITSYQFAQHMVALIILSIQLYHRCITDYEQIMIGLLGYAFFFAEYIRLIRINILVMTSFLFLTNCIHIYAKQDLMYFYAFLSLFLTSSLYHSTRLSWILTLDKMAILNVVIQGGIRLIMNAHHYWSYSCIAMVCFFFNIYLYYIGRQCSKSIYWHAILHLTGSIGHHCIMALS